MKPWWSPKKEAEGLGGAARKRARAAPAAPPVKRARARASVCGPVEPHDLVDMTAPAVLALSDRQREVLQAVNNGHHVFLTGGGGCGKTKTTLALASAVPKGTCECAAPTGVAAQLIGGVTLHSLLSLGIANDHPVPPGDDVAAAARAARVQAAVTGIRGKSFRRRLVAMRVFIIDEVSMLSAETFEVVLEVLRQVRTAARVAPLPQLFLVGDFFQLQAVQGSLLLTSDAFKQVDPKVFNLQHSFRQEGDDAFVRILNDIRVGHLSPEGLAALQSRVVSDDDVAAQVEARTAPGLATVYPTALMPYRREVDAENARRLLELPGDLVSYHADLYIGTRSRPKDKTPPGPWGPVAGSVAVDPEQVARYPRLAGTRVSAPAFGGSALDRVALAEMAAMADTSLVITLPVVTLKVGAQVMFTCNQGRTICNGTRGVVVDVSDPVAPRVQLASGEVVSAAPVARATPVSDALARGLADAGVALEDRLTEGPCVVCEQVPLALAWALTIHKAQGATLTLARVSLNVFAAGQAYVALSRVPSLDALFLKDFEPDAVRAEGEVIEWYRRFGG